MTNEDIKPIPKYILKKIVAKDKKDFGTYGYVRFYSYLAIWKKELVKITVAVKFKNNQRYCKQVAVHGLHSEKCFVKDLEYNPLGMGWRVGWHEQGLSNFRNWYETDSWCDALDKYYDPYAPIINKSLIAKLPEYKYSAFKEFSGVKILQYLRTYEKYPQAELLVKFGLQYLTESIMILKRAANDKSFRKWLIKNRLTLSKGYYFGVILEAYKSGKPLDEIQKIKKFKNQIIHDSTLKPLKEFFKGKGFERLYYYIRKQNTSLYSYKDYIRACNYLKLDMTQNKNFLPHDFKRWHDERIAQYQALLYEEQERRRKENAAREERERNERFEQFTAVSKKYLPLADCNQNGLMIAIAQTPADLVKEGQALNHCVGGIGYTNSMARGETLIFFVRNASTPDIPFVTLEYSISQKRVLQCYAYNNTKPNETVLDFVNNIWLPFANKKIRTVKKPKLKAA